MSFSKLNSEEKRKWIDEARKSVYIGLEPVSPEKEAIIPARARDLYYAAKAAQ